MSTKGEPVDEVTDVPETPKWTKFFEGPLFQKYQEFMKSHDFSKILINGSVLNQNHLTAPDYDFSDVDPDDRKNSDRNTLDTKRYEKEKMGDSRLNSNSENILTSPDFQKRQRRTRGLVVLGVVVIAAVALATGLVIHYLVIPKDSNIKKQFNISLASNMSGTSLEDTTTTTTITATVRKEESDKLDALKSAVKAPTKIEELESTIDNVFTIVKNKQLGIVKSSSQATTSRKPRYMPTTSKKTKRIRASTTAATIIKATRHMSTANTTNAAKTLKTIPENTTKLIPRMETTTTKETTSLVTTTTASVTTTVPTKATTTQISTATSTKATTTQISTATSSKATTTQITTTLPDKYNVVAMAAETGYVDVGPVSITCRVDRAIQWDSISMKGTKRFANDPPVGVTITHNGIVHWLKRNARLDVSYTSTENKVIGNDVVVNLTFDYLQCKDADTYTCHLTSRKGDVKSTFDFRVEGKPQDMIQLQLGPSVVEDQALRLTAQWVGGYPEPWANLTWLAQGETDAEPKDLRNYGNFKEYILEKDDYFCETTMKHSIVIFPKMNLNSTTIYVKPDINKAEKYLTTDKIKELKYIEPATEKLLVIPADYCAHVKAKDLDIVHPYEPCRKYVRCPASRIPVVYDCPVGTCFLPMHGKCGYKTQNRDV
ncbi:hypothetical protein CHS0354_020555 [Potamilus streckersoni]|uniref:Ig-like domain-containing protein n=1 Tax=Potamilus streckersoni TaxID=2493646 RepID=A0AAE0SNS6_9BIVA|nr:hypothetical protein CHS0354_020555 [Potamilus streckersoni]